MAKLAPKITDHPDEVAVALEGIGLSHEAVVKIARAAVAARAESLPIDPVSAPGWFAYAYGVRHLRLEMLLKEGWRRDRTGNVESVVNDEKGIQLCFQNVDLACNPGHIPQAISGKGSASRKQIAEGQRELFPRPPQDDGDHVGCAPVVWVVCVEATDGVLRAEVSCPTAFEGSQFRNFHERIFVIDEQLDEVVPSSEQDESGLEDLDVPVSKKL